MHQANGATIRSCRCSHAMPVSPSRSPRVSMRAKHVKPQASPLSPAASWIEFHLPDLGSVTEERPLGSSGWSSSSTLTTSLGRRLFVKTSRQRDDTMFKGEALGLKAMADTATVRVPRVYAYGAFPEAHEGVSRGSFIIMEALEMEGAPDQAALGRAIAQMHLAEPKHPEALKGRFGFSVDNTIGGTPQPNGWMDNWVDFFRERRLAHQLKLAGNPTLSRYGDRLLPKLETFFQDMDVIRPSILHGDLWSGNIAASGGEPTIYDPACYYGHHEAEWGMSWCAGFDGQFWRAYNEVLPRAPGWEERHQLYTLYHILNHLNLFGDGYYSQAEGIMKGLVSRL